MVVVQHSAETFATRNQTCSAGIWAGIDQAIANPLMVSLVVIQLSKATPILGMFAKFAIVFIPGMAVQYGCMRAS